MIMFQREFKTYNSMIEHLSTHMVDRADFKQVKGNWVLNTVTFDNVEDDDKVTMIHSSGHKKTALKGTLAYSIYLNQGYREIDKN